MSAFRRVARRPSLAACVAIGAFVAVAPSALAAERRVVPAMTIYPGDIIRDQMLTDADFPNAVASSVFATNHSMLIGRVAIRTLLPGQPIPTSAIGVPRIISVGAMVRVIYEEGGLEIATYASALQNGAAGDVIAVRNLESGVTLSGVVRADGSIHVGPT